MNRITKKDAIRIFGKKQIDMAEALGYSKSAISVWPELLTVKQTRMVLGAALLAKRKIPKELLK